MSIEEYFNDVLRMASRMKASDVHLTAGCPVRLRVGGDLVTPDDSKKLRVDDTSAIALHVLKVAGRLRSSDPAERYEAIRDTDCSYGLSGVGRFRVNVCQQRGTVAVVLRAIPMDLPTVDDLRLPPVINEIAMEPRGLALITGMTGSGKSTTLAAMIHLINQTRPCKIVTIEDPIEFVHKDIQASIMQREVGCDTTSFGRAMRAVLRQDPDVILVGEMRDEETVEIALKAAETGHLVMSTLHTTDTAKTINRLISFVSPGEQNFLRLRLADSLKAIVSQRLLPTADGRGRVPAVEILRTTETIKDCLVHPEKTGKIYDHLRSGRDHYAMQTFDQHLQDLHAAGTITLDVARAAATSPADFERNLVYV